MRIFRSKKQQSTESAKRSSKRYRESTHLIPTPGARSSKGKAWPLSTWKVLTLAVFMIVLGVVIQIVRAISAHNDGFSVPQKNVFQSVAQPSFLTAFFPTLFVFPLSYFWASADRVLRLYQPYITLLQGHARAEDSLLEDYVMSNVFFTLFKTLKRREWIIHMSMATALVTNLYQPLAGALLTVRQTPKTHPQNVSMSTTLGLAPDVSTLNAFLAAAGFTEAAAFQGLPDPPFILGGWSVAQFHPVAAGGLNASVVLSTTGVNSAANCSVPPTINLDTSIATNYTITVHDADGCTSVAAFNPASADQQYGTSPALPGTCGLDPALDVSFAPLMFWFFHTSDSGVKQARAVMCRPHIELFNVDAQVYLTNNSLMSVEPLSNYTTANNVSGDPLHGKAYNAVLFNQSSVNDFVKARAVAIQSQIPGAIFRFASQDPNVLQTQFFDPPNGFLSLTDRIYTQHLAVSAKTVYFVSTSSENEMGQYTSLVERLVVDTLAAHGLSALLLLIGMLGIWIHLAHARMRRALHLAAPPGTLAAAVALTSHSGFGALLFPYDDARTIAGKLARLRFSLDARTGAVVADEYGFDGEGVRGSPPMPGGSAEKVELRSMPSNVLLHGNAFGRDLEDVQEPELPYEQEPLVSPRPKRR
ncbi:DUF3433 domain-containing protein [Phanerochaete sordida]|uniref:DUF3433 domain-containing protein n=1 Tax=Phanerochaete sordida TaxID=48140 RepID=A0A9P3LGX9_9APHY|nr:DUF3433 domain-containing protein [Phanerochaete sordida]